MVTVYSLPACSGCNSTKQWLKARGVEFEDIDLSQDTDAVEKVMGQWGYRQAPVVDTGSVHWSGHDVEKLSEFIGT